MDEEDIKKVEETFRNNEFNNEEEDQEDFKRVEKISKDEVVYHEEKENTERVEEIKEVKVEEIPPMEPKEEEISIPKEYNNEEEDQEEMGEEKGGFFQNKMNYVIIGLVFIILVLVGIILLDSFSKKNSNQSTGDSTQEATLSKTTKKTSTSKVDIAKSESYFINANYLYVINNNKNYIANLDGKVLAEEEMNCTKPDSNPYLLCEDNKSRYVIKKVDNDGTVVDIYTETKGDPSHKKIYDENGKFLGIYSAGKKGGILSLIDSNSTTTTSLEDEFLYVYSKDSSSTKTLYYGRYAIVTKDKESSDQNSSKGNYGLYDLQEDKLLIPLKYQELAPLFGDYYIATLQGKSGIVDRNNNVKLELKYDKVGYSNGLYFTVQNNVLRVLDANFKELDVPIKKSFNDLTAFSDRVILHHEAGYSIVDQTGKLTDYDFTSFGIYYGYLLTQKGNIMTLYDTTLNKMQEFNTDSSGSVDLNTAVVFLEDNLILNGKKLFDIPSGNFQYEVKELTRSYQGYMVLLSIHDNKVDVTVTLDDKPVGSIQDVDCIAFLRAENNGIAIRNGYLIVSIGNKNLILKDKRA